MVVGGHFLQSDSISSLFEVLFKNWLTLVWRWVAEPLGDLARSIVREMGKACLQVLLINCKESKTIIESVKECHEKNDQH